MSFDCSEYMVKFVLWLHINRGKGNISLTVELLWTVLTESLFEIILEFRILTGRQYVVKSKHSFRNSTIISLIFVIVI